MGGSSAGRLDPPAYWMEAQPLSVHSTFRPRRYLSACSSLCRHSDLNPSHDDAAVAARFSRVKKPAAMFCRPTQAPLAPEFDVGGALQNAARAHPGARAFAESLHIELAKAAAGEDEHKRGGVASVLVLERGMDLTS